MVSVSLPQNSIFLTNTINNLKQFVTPSNTNGVFAGPSVSSYFSSTGETIYDFIPSQVGNDYITFTYTDAGTGCIKTITKIISVVNGLPIPTVSTTKNPVCRGESIILSATSINLPVSYIWNVVPSNTAIDRNFGGIIYTAPNATNTTYTVIATNACGTNS